MPSTSPATISTIVAATMAAVPPYPSPTAFPPAAVLALTPTASPPAAALPPATRLDLPADTTTGTVTGQIQPGEVRTFAIAADVGQSMLARVDSPGQIVTLSVKTQGGTSLLGASALQSLWRGILPRTEDYFVSVYGGTISMDFTLTVQLARRITFKEGETSATVRGDTVAGSSMVYSVFAVKGQKMIVDISATVGSVALDISGWVDGKSILQAGARRDQLTLRVPATQDYIIQVVPPLGKSLRFVLTVEFQ